MNGIDSIFYIIVLIMSVVVHEVSHGYAALYFGDRTAKLAGRLTLNPVKHLDWFGSVLLPAILIFTNAPFLIGWAKPVPYNPNNLRNYKWGSFAVAGAGVLANILIAVIFSIIFRIGIIESASPQFITAISTIVLMNLALALFNLVPIPPLDGSKLLFAFLPASTISFQQNLERYSLILFLIFIIYFADALYVPLAWLFGLLTGVAL